MDVESHCEYACVEFKDELVTEPLMEGNLYELELDWPNPQSLSFHEGQAAHHSHAPNLGGAAEVAALQPYWKEDCIVAIIPQAETMHLSLHQSVVFHASAKVL